jgi:hypothetical protein
VQSDTAEVGVELIDVAKVDLKEEQTSSALEGAARVAALENELGELCTSACL